MPTVRLFRITALFLGLILALAGWPSWLSAQEPENRRERRAAPYRVLWNISMTADNAPLFSASAAAAPGRPSVTRTDSTVPVEGKPALPLLTATLSPTDRPDQFEMTILVSVREAIRNKKGKLKFSKRNIGALVPIQLGETQWVSSSADPIRVEVRIERN
jgi:hypothetical protein